jgi:hypothetical protein
LSFSSPALVQAKLEEIEADLAVLQNSVEEAAMSWFQAKREREKARAQTFMASEGTVAEREALAAYATATEGMEAEAAWEGKRAALKALEARGAIGMSILRSQGRPGA